MGKPTGETIEFRAPVAGGELVGCIGGGGPDLLLLHGGPVSNYMEPLADELRDGYRVATYQQRGLEPSTLAAPFDVSRHVADVTPLTSRYVHWSPIFGAAGTTFCASSSASNFPFRTTPMM